LIAARGSAAMYASMEASVMSVFLLSLIAVSFPAPMAS
jgi:hypothetical protein